MRHTHVAVIGAGVSGSEMAEADFAVRSHGLPAHGLALPGEAAHRVPRAGSPKAYARLHSAADSVADVVGIELTIHDDLHAVAAEWLDFQDSADCTPFGSFAWVSALNRHILPQRTARPAIVFGRDETGQLVFILPLAIERVGPFRRLTWLGSELCDYNTPLLGRAFKDHPSAGDFPTLWREVLRTLRADRRFRFDFVDLGRMPDDVGEQKNPFVQLPVLLHPSGAHLAELEGPWPAFYESKRSTKTRKTDRKKLNGLRQQGDVRLVEAADPCEAEQTLETLFAQKSAWFARMGISDLFARPGYRDFFRAVACDPDLRGLVHLTRLDAGDTVASTALGLCSRGRYYLILSSYEDGPLARFGPGRMHLHELLRHAIESGCKHFDFTVGDEPYKREWAEIELRLYDHLAAATVRGWLVVSAIAGYRRTKRLVKQTPILWRAYTTWREWRGRVPCPASAGAANSP